MSLLKTIAYRSVVYVVSMLITSVMLSVIVGRAKADPSIQLTGDYFKIPNSHPDAGPNGGNSGGQGFVNSTLGPDGLPVLSSYGAAQDPPWMDINASNEILWWSTDSHYGVLSGKEQMDTLPFHFTNFFPDGQATDSPYYRSVHWHGVFSLPYDSGITIELASDDDGWAFVDGVLVADNGGIKPENTVTSSLPDLSAGSHTLDVFFDDREPASSAISMRLYYGNVPYFLPGDFNRDGVVDARDILVGEMALTNTDKYESDYNVTDSQFPLIADVNFSGDVTNADLQALLNELSGRESSSPVPEPSTFLLFAIGIAMLQRCRHLHGN